MNPLHLLPVAPLSTTRILTEALVFSSIAGIAYSIIAKKNPFVAVSLLAINYFSVLYFDKVVHHYYQTNLFKATLIEITGLLTIQAIFFVIMNKLNMMTSVPGMIFMFGVTGLMTAINCYELYELYHQHI